MPPYSQTFYILTRLEGLRLKGWMDELLRDIRFAVSLSTLVLLGVCAVVAIAMRASGPGGVALGLAVGYVLFDRALPQADSALVMTLRHGVLRPWLAFDGALNRWLLVRAMVLSLGAIALVAALIAFVRPAEILPWLECSTGGVCACLLVRSFGKDRLTSHLPTLWKQQRHAPPWRGLYRAIVVVLLLMLAIAISILARRNNASSEIGLAVLTALSLLIAVYATWPNLTLLRFLAQQPIGLPRLMLRYWFVPVIVTFFVMAAASLLAGLSWPYAALCTLMTVLAMALWLGLLIGYGMTRTARGAMALVICDLVSAAIFMFAFQLGVLAVVWLVIRLILLYRGLPRRRWRDIL